jgi:hypothetical protein
MQPGTGLLIGGAWSRLGSPTVTFFYKEGFAPLWGDGLLNPSLPDRQLAEHLKHRHDSG